MLKQKPIVFRIACLTFIRVASAAVLFSTNSFCAEKASPTEVVKRYLAASSWEETLNYIRNSDKLRPAMVKRYEKNPFPGRLINQLVQVKETGTVDSKWTAVKVKFRGKVFGEDVEHYKVFLLEQTSKGYLIDWEALVGHNSMTLAAYKIQKPKATQVFRFTAAMANYYNYEFLDKAQTMYCIRLVEYDETTGSIYGYIEKDSSDGKQLYELLKDGEPHEVILSVHYSPNHLDPYADQVLIDKLIRTSWRAEN